LNNHDRVPFDTGTVDAYLSGKDPAAKAIANPPRVMDAPVIRGIS